MGPRQQLDRVDSTQRLALEHARAHGPEAAVFVAEEQSAGVGRLDHAWCSPRGGLYLSIVAPDPGHRVELVALGVAASLATRLAARFGAPTAIRWPNDVLVHSAGRPRKIAGVLADLVTSPTRAPAVVVGIGVNVARVPGAFAPELASEVAFLNEFAPSALASDVEPIALEAVAATLERLATADGNIALVAESRSLLLGLGHYVSVDGVRAGVARSLDDEGALWVEDGATRRPVRAGSLVIEEAA